MMYRVYLFSLLLSLLYIDVSATSLNAEKALDLAQQYVNHNRVFLSSNQVGNLKLAYSATSAKGMADYYVFNIGKDNGFVIVGGDDQVIPIWGYSDNGAFDLKKLPENMRWWLQEYQRQLEWVRNHPGTKKRAAIKISTSIGPLLTTKWDQNKPYNNNCPDIPASYASDEDWYNWYGGHVPTGCVATATAQIMKYYNWPAKGTGRHSYTVNVDQSYDITLTADFGSSNYEWGLMTDEYYYPYWDGDYVYCNNEGEESYKATQAQQDAIAKLMSDVGIAMDMEYATYGSAASCWYAVNALQHNFYYSDSWQYYYRDEYSGDWDAMLRKELDDKRPILYAGSSPKSGHAFIVDGYREDGYFHINWGWGGSCDGYFVTNLLNADEDEANHYNDDQYAYIGIQPDYNSVSQTNLPGDVNDDKIIDIEDVNTTIDHILRLSMLSESEFERADCNRDNIVDVIDINIIINRILRVGYQHTEPMSLVIEQRYGSNALFSLTSNPSLTFDGDKLIVKSNNTTDYFYRSRLLKIYYLPTALANNLQGKSGNVMADNPNQNAIYIYRNDNDFNAHLNLDIKRIQFSSIGTNGTWYDNAIVQEVWTTDSVFRTPIAAIDSITFQAPAPVMKQGLFVITEEHVPYMTTATDSTLTFKTSTPANMRPVNGQVVYSELTNDWFVMGFAGRVTTVSQQGNVVTYKCEPVAPSDVYDRLVTVGKIEASGNDDNSTPRRIADDGVVTSPKISIDVGYEDYIRVKGSASMTIDYAFNFGFGSKDYANVTITNNLELSLSTAFKTSLGNNNHEMLLPIPVAYIGNKFVGASVNVGLFFNLSGSVELGLTIPYKIKHIEEYKWSSDDFFHISYDKRSDGGWGSFGDAIDDAQCVFKIKGGAKFGPVVKASVMIWKPSFLSINTALKGGPQIDASFEFDFNDPNSYSAYNLLAEDTKLSTGMYLGLDVTAQTWKKEHKLATIGTTLFKRDSYLFPRFTKPVFPVMVSESPAIWEDGINPLAVYTIPSNNLWLPGKVGLGLFDQSGNCLGKRYFGSWYFGGTERDWNKTWLQYDITDDTNPGETYEIRPLFKLLNLIEVKGSPKSQLTVPNHLSLNKSEIEITKGNETGILINGGWGAFSLTNSKPKVVSASIYDSGDNHYVRIKGLKTGTAKLTITDSRSQETASLAVTVLDEQLLVLESDAVRICAGETTTVSVLNGTGSYSVNSENSQVATAQITTQGNGQTGNLTMHNVVITGVAPGQTTLTVTDNNSSKTATITVTVFNPDQGLSLSSYDIIVLEGESRYISINEGSGNYRVISNTNPSVATATFSFYSSDRQWVVINALSQGSTTIKVKDITTNLQATINVEVRSAYGDIMCGSPNPEDGAIVDNNWVNISCDAPYEYGAVYQVCLSERPDMSVIQKTVNISNHVYAVSFYNLKPSTTYYWRVSKWDWELEKFLIISPIWSFTTSNWDQ